MVYVSKKQLSTTIKQILRGEINQDVMLIDDDPARVLDKLMDTYEFIEAAGGLVKNERNEFLFIFRAGKWDLPKGKLEKKELPSDGAKREVEEECGVEILEVLEELPSTYHVYELKGKIILKQTFWYKMTATSGQALVPQVDEGISEVRWFLQNDFPMVYANTYLSILQVLENVE